MRPPGEKFLPRNVRETDLIRSVTHRGKVGILSDRSDGKPGKPSLNEFYTNSGEREGRGQTPRGRIAL
jgi:hypothetical protein